MLEASEGYQPRFLKVDGFATYSQNVTQPQEREALQELRHLFDNEEALTLQGFRELADDYGLALIEDERYPLQDKDLDSYRLVKRTTDEGEEIGGNEIHEKLNDYTVAMITFKRQSQ